MKSLCQCKTCYTMLVPDECSWRQPQCQCQRMGTAEMVAISVETWQQRWEQNCATHQHTWYEVASSEEGSHTAVCWGAHRRQVWSVERSVQCHQYAHLPCKYIFLFIILIIKTFVASLSPNYHTGEPAVLTLLLTEVLMEMNDMTVGLWQFSFVGSLTLSAVGFSLYHLTSIWKHCEYEEEVPSIFRQSWYGSMTGSYIMELWIECKFSDCKYQ